MRYIIGALALVVSFGSFAESEIIPLQDVQISNIRYSATNTVFIRIVGNPLDGRCSREIRVINPNTGPLELSVASKFQEKAGLGAPVTVNLRIEDSNVPGTSGRCEVVQISF